MKNKVYPNTPIKIIERDKMMPYSSNSENSQNKYLNTDETETKTKMVDLPTPHSGFSNQKFKL